MSAGAELVRTGPVDGSADNRFVAISIQPDEATKERIA